MNYKIIYVEASCSFAGALKKVEKEVNEHLKDGWSLHGPLNIVSHSSSGYFVVSQAMTKWKEQFKCLNKKIISFVLFVAKEHQE